MPHLERPLRRLPLALRPRLRKLPGQDVQRVGGGVELFGHTEQFGRDGGAVAWEGGGVSIVVNGETIVPGESERVERIIDDGDTLIVVHVHRALVVRCGVCAATFPGYEPESTTQASGCAAVYVDGKIEGFYGSRIADMTMFDVAESLRAELAPRIDPVCDGCIQRWLDAGLAREHGEVRYGHRYDGAATVVPHRRGQA